MQQISSKRKIKAVSSCLYQVFQKRTSKNILGWKKHGKIVRHPGFVANQCRPPPRIWGRISMHDYQMSFYRARIIARADINCDAKRQNTFYDDDACTIRCSNRHAQFTSTYFTLSGNTSSLGL